MAEGYQVENCNQVAFVVCWDFVASFAAAVAVVVAVEASLQHAFVRLDHSV